LVIAFTDDWILSQVDFNPKNSKLLGSMELTSNKNPESNGINMKAAIPIIPHVKKLFHSTETPPGDVFYFILYFIIIRFYSFSDKNEYADTIFKK
jgi:hypothetical protein